MDVATLIASLGGAAAVARQCGVSPQAAYKWLAEGSIPARHWLRLWRMAKERGLDWRPPGAEGLDLAIVPDTARHDAEPPTFTQCSHIGACSPAPQEAAG